jgi:hypothetical protein
VTVNNLKSFLCKEVSGVGALIGPSWCEPVVQIKSLDYLEPTVPSSSD